MSRPYYREFLRVAHVVVFVCLFMCATVQAQSTSDPYGPIYLDKDGKPATLQFDSKGNLTTQVFIRQDGKLIPVNEQTWFDKVAIPEQPASRVPFLGFTDVQDLIGFVAAWSVLLGIIIALLVFGKRGMARMAARDRDRWSDAVKNTAGLFILFVAAAAASRILESSLGIWAIIAVVLYVRFFKSTPGDSAPAAVVHGAPVCEPIPSNQKPPTHPVFDTQAGYLRYSPQFLAARDRIWQREINRMGEAQFYRRLKAVGDYYRGEKDASGHEEWHSDLDAEIKELYKLRKDSTSAGGDDC